MDDDGYLPSEITRGRRALVYHMRFLTYILLLRAARRAIGIHARPWEEARLKILGARICSTLCNPKEMASKAQSPDMEQPGEWGARTIVAFGKDLLTEGWQKCGIQVKNYCSIGDGGDQNVMRKMFEELAREHDAANEH